MAAVQLTRTISRSEPTLGQSRSRIAETISGYFELRDLVTREVILTEVVDLLTERLTLTEDRYQKCRIFD